MLHRPLNIRPLGTEQRIGKTGFITDGSRHSGGTFLRGGCRWQQDIAPSCAATLGSDVFEEQDQTPAKIDVRNLKTALNIVYSYDSSKKLKLPRIIEKRQFLIGGTQQNTFLNNYLSNYNKGNVGKSATGLQPKKELPSSSGKKSPEVTFSDTMKSKHDLVKSPRKKSPLKTILKKSIPTKQKTDEMIAQIRAVQSKRLRKRLGRSEIHRVSFELGSLNLGRLPPIAENSAGEEEEERRYRRMRRLRGLQSRTLPSTDQVHGWLEDSGHRILATKESFHEQEEVVQDDTEMPPKMHECGSGVKGLLETAEITRKSLKTGSRNVQVHAESITNFVTADTKVRNGTTLAKVIRPVKNKNSPKMSTTLEEQKKDSNWKPSNIEKKKIALKKIMHSDNVKEAELPGTTSTKVIVEPLSQQQKFRRDPVIAKSSKQQVQKWVNTSTPHSCQRNRHHTLCANYLTKASSKHGLHKNKKKPKSISIPSKQESQESSKQCLLEPTPNTCTSDMLNSWIMQLTYG